jgi:hypothetical protein
MRTMKNITTMRHLLTLVIILFCFTANTQEDLNRYQKYLKKFEERGAKDIEDGWHEGVVITVRVGQNADSFYGKVKVESGAVKTMFMRYPDGTYDTKPYQKTYKHEDELAIITSGVSKTKITIDNELINVFFVHHIKPPAKKYEMAPDPDDL